MEIIQCYGDPKEIRKCFEMAKNGEIKNMSFDNIKHNVNIGGYSTHDESNFKEYNIPVGYNGGVL